MTISSIVPLVLQGIVVLIIVGSFWLRMESRLTKIETDVKWLKALLEVNGGRLFLPKKGGAKNEK